LFIGLASYECYQIPPDWYLESLEVRGTCFLALPKMSLCGKLVIRRVVLLYCMALGGDWSAEMSRKVAK